jgi:[glutamine synthetase] adenylyltransferase / [glutamine synthetase]-adenylyl-L-tyrosine phosphorylase
MIPLVSSLLLGPTRPPDLETLSQLESAGFNEPLSAWMMLSELASKTENIHAGRERFSALADAIVGSYDPTRALNNLYVILTNSQNQTASKILTLFSDSPLEAQALTCICSGSQSLSMDLIQDPNRLLSLFNNQSWQSLGTREALAERSSFITHGTDSFDEGMSALREFKRWESLHIAMCDLLKLVDTSEILVRLADAADLCLQGAVNISSRVLESQHGQPLLADGSPDGFCVIGMGKLGGRELNFSSDIDLLYVYDSPHGRTSVSGLSSYEYYPKLARMITDAIHRITSEGFVFRVDLRLRPEGSAGDIANAVEGYHRHYAARGQIWERQALIKARPIAGSQRTGDAFLSALKPFVFDDQSDPLILDEINRNREKIAHALLKRNSGAHHVKLGPGGIREIEFLTQGFQLIHTGVQQWPWERGTLQALDWITRQGYLGESEAQDLNDAYLFLRDLENRIQIAAGHQAHEIPSDTHSRNVLARMMGIKGQGSDGPSETLLSRYKAHTDRVVSIYERVFHTVL